MIAAENLSKEKQNSLDWKQKTDIVTIQVFELSLNGNRDQLTNLLTELKSKNVMFTLKIAKNNNFLLIYSLNNSRNTNKNTALINYFVQTYSLKDTVNAEEFFIQNVKKVVQKDNILQFFHEGGKQSYALALLLSSMDSDSTSFSKRFTNFIINLVKADLFSIVISSIPSIDRAASRHSKWALMFLIQDDNRIQIEKKEDTFHRFLNANSSKLNCKLSYITKKEFVKHKTNFRYLVPWHYHKDEFTDNVEINKLLNIDTPALTPAVEDYTKTLSRTQSPPTQEKLKIKEDQVVKRPFPSVKASNSNKHSSAQVKAKTKRKTKPTIIKRDNYLVSNLDDISIPMPKTMNVVFDLEYLKVRISKMFKDFEFKETVIFEDNFDLVLRKGSFYIFIKFYKKILNQAEAYKIIEHLGSIAGLRNQFLCIVVADTIEEKSMKILNEFNVLHLTLSDVLLEDTLKSKIYNTILA